MGGGAHVCVDKPQSEDGQRLRKAVCHRRGIRLRGDDAAYGEEVGPCVGISRQSLEGEFSEVELRLYGVLRTSALGFSELRKEWLEGSSRIHHHCLCWLSKEAVRTPLAKPLLLKTQAKAK